MVTWNPCDDKDEALKEQGQGAWRAYIGGMFAGLVN